mgnify:FL=1
MNRYDIMNYIQHRYDIEPEYLWDKFPDYAVFRHPNNGKWFAIIMNVDTTSVGIEHEGPRSMVNSTECDLLVIKADPEDVEFYKTQPGFGPAYHMNKKHWLSILVSGPADEEDVLGFVDESYRLTLL